MITESNVKFIEEALASTFGYEWHQLPQYRKWSVADDFSEAHDSEDLSATVYKARIGEGNLHAYANTLKAPPITRI